MVVEQWDESFSTLDAYRGVNANMHTVEALLSAADVLGDPAAGPGAADPHPRRARPRAAATSGASPSTSTTAGRRSSTTTSTTPAHPFRPYGATIGHWLEWARLALHLRAALGDAAPDWLLDDARGAVRRLGPRGLGGRRRGRVRLHRRLGGQAGRTRADALGRGRGHGDGRGPARGDRRRVVRRVVRRPGGSTSTTCFRDPEHGSWHHELSPANRAERVTWQGKPDTYHAFQATLIPRLPLTPMLAKALADGLLA